MPEAAAAPSALARCKIKANKRTIGYVNTIFVDHGAADTRMIARAPALPHALQRDLEQARSVLVISRRKDYLIVDNGRCGDVVVLEYINSKEIVVKFVNTGAETTVAAGDIRKGYIRDTSLHGLGVKGIGNPLAKTVYGVGYLGGTTYRKKTHPLLYRKWSDMLMRCYSEKYLTKYPSYKNCSVCDEWLNFQTFASWAEVNWIDGYELDKDIKVKDNKVYSPEFCMFVTRAENMRCANENK